MNSLKILIPALVLLGGAVHAVHAQPARVTADPTDFHFLVDGRPFVPLGYYITEGTLAELKYLRSHHVNTVILYYYAIAEHYHVPPDTGSYHARYLRGLKPYLDSLQRYNIKAIVDLQAKLAERGVQGFTAEGILSIVHAYKSHPAVFGWLIEEEGYYQFRTKGFPTWRYVRDLKVRINAEDPGHPVVFVETNTTLDGTTFFGEGESDYHGNELYDILGYDKYVYDGRKGRQGEEYSDVNLVSREAVHRIMPQIAARRKYGLLFIAQCVDRAPEIITPDYPPLTSQQVWYQSLSPIIRGARGLLYWWRQPDPAVEYSSSPATLRQTDGFFDWFTRHGLADVITRGINKKQRVRLGSLAGVDSLTILSKDASLDSTRVSWKFYQWQHFNNYGFHKKTRETRFARHDDPSLSDPDFLLFDFMARQMGNRYYLFAANDYRLQVRTRFILDRMIAPGRRVTRVVELDPSGEERRLPVTRNARTGKVAIELRFEGHSVKAIRIETGSI